MKNLVFGLLSCVLGLMGCKENPKSDQPGDVQSDSVAQEKVSDKPLITPIAHATAVVQWGESTIYIDPVGGAAAFEGRALPNLILITDIHGDHMDIPTLEGLDLGNAQIVAPRAVAEKLTGTLADRVTVLDNGSTTEHAGILVEAIPMYNLREEAKDFHVPGRGNGYVLEKDGIRLYFSGDTEDIPEMRNLKNIDMAFVCMNLPYTMTVESAADAVLEFAPAKVFPYHYRGRPEVSDVGRFRELVQEGNPSIEVVQLDWYPGESY